MVASRQIDSTKARMSSTRQAVVLDPSLTGFGYLPDLIPFHHEERLTGIMGVNGGAKGSHLAE